MNLLDAYVSVGPSSSRIHQSDARVATVALVRQPRPTGVIHAGKQSESTIGMLLLFFHRILEQTTAQEKNQKS